MGIYAGYIQLQHLKYTTTGFDWQLPEKNIWLYSKNEIKSQRNVLLDSVYSDTPSLQ